MLSWCCHDVVMKVFECDDVVMMLSLVGFVGLGPDDESQRRGGGGCRQGGATWDSSARACPELLSRPDQGGEGAQGAAEQNQPPPAVGQTRLQARLSQWAEVWPSRSLQELHCCLSAVVGHEGDWAQCFRGLYSGWFTFLQNLQTGLNVNTTQEE